MASSWGVTMKTSLRIAALLLAFGFNRTAARADATKSAEGEEAAGITSSKCDRVSDNLVGNCGFETGAYYPWLHSQPPCFCAVTGQSRFTGNFGLEYGPTSLTYVWQLIPTVPGQQYKVSFLLRNIGGEDPVAKETVVQSNLFRMYWEGDLVYELADAPQFPWTPILVDGFLSSRATSELRFGFYNPQDWWHFDDVVIVPSPK